MKISLGSPRAAMRRLGAVTAAVAAVGALSLTAPGVAAAHVSANAPTLTQGGWGVVTFVVPNESDTAATTSLRVTLPNLKSARPEAMAGWSAEVTRDPATQEATAVTWTADPDTPGVPVGEFGQFRISGGPFPEEETILLPALQTYADGEAVDWAEPVGDDGSEPDRPAPTLTLPAGSGDHSHGHGSSTDEASAEEISSSDDTARWLGGIGLLVGALGVVVGAAALSRSRQGK